ncbi:processed acidic surface protein [Lysinibacillus composti]|uniref:Processed acidic surface protein n=1 Tax=Lysinibacillus composti TaxID=720633 RepID=A0A3N9UEU6_9BACI|nr:processed acidic surface protein [Lysinibacillus composti]MBM7608467.1 processed acidic surface protein [Lysinibacillus composti]RQW74759.1 processed acidic surface protein [Lysinibacillus composti]
MKKLGALLLSFSLLIALFPQLTMAAQDTSFEQDLTSYLQQVSSERGFEVTKEDVEMILSYYDDGLENFDSVEELADFLGEVIKADYSNLNTIYEEYDLNQESLELLLQENGEVLTDYIFLDDLDSSVYFYSEDGVFERDPNFDQDLVTYLTTISEQRGFDVTKEDVEITLADYDLSLDDFESVEELSDFLGEVIKADYSNLDYLYETYETTQQELFSLLEENGESINDYIFIDDLKWLFADVDLSDLLDYLFEDLAPLLEQIDLSDEELNQMKNHLMSLEDHLSNPDTAERLNQLGEELMTFDLDVTIEPTLQQVAKIASIYEEFFSIFQVKASYSLVKGDSETPISFTDLLNLEDLEGTNFKVAFYTLDGQFLADLILTEEFLNSEFLNEIGNEIEESVDEVTEEPVVKTNEQIVAKTEEYQTVKGGKLPKTATDYIPNALIGLMIVMLGLFMFRKVRNA